MSSASATPQLRRVLGRGDLLALAWGAMVGWGWVILSGSMSERAGTLGSALAFGIAALVIGTVGLLYAELTARIPRAGGELAFCFAGLRAVLAFARGGGLSAASLVVTLLFLLLYVPGSPVALSWPEEWGIIAVWAGLGLALCAPRLRSARFDPDRAKISVLGASDPARAATHERSVAKS